MTKGKPKKKRGPIPDRLVIPPEQVGGVLDNLLGTPKKAEPAEPPKARPKPKKQAP